MQRERREEESWRKEIGLEARSDTTKQLWEGGARGGADGRRFEA